MSERRLKPSRRPSLKQRRISIIRQEAPATRLYEFLKPKESQPDVNSPVFLKDLALATVLILNDGSDPKLVEVLKNFGWNGSNQYGKNLDVRGLLIALKRLERKSTSFALSSFQQKPSVACFAPEILITILDAHAMEYSAIEQIVPRSVFFEGVCLLVDISGTLFRSSVCNLLNC